MSDVYPSVPPVATAAPAAATTFNPSISALAVRTDYLRRRLELSEASSLSGAVILQDTPISNSVSVGNLVSYNSQTNLHEPAIMILDGDSRPLASSVPVGLILAISGDTAALAFSGTIDLPTTGVVVSGEVMQAGHWYLSHLEAGKLTQNPQAPAMYVGTVNKTATGYNMLLRIDGADGHAHHHVETTVYPAPAGTVLEDNGSHAVIGYEPDTTAEGVDSLARLSVVSTGDADATYAFTLTGDGTVAGTKVTWVTDNNSDSGAASITGVQVPGFEVPFLVGDFGVTIMLHRAITPGINYDYADGSDYDTLFPGAAVASDRTYTLKLPEQGSGWVSHVSRTLAQLGTSDRGLLIFGINTWGPDQGNLLSFGIDTSGGDITSGISIDVTYPDGTQVTKASVVLGSIYTLSNGLYMSIAPAYNTTAIGSDTTVSAFTSIVDLVDEAPDALLTYTSLQNPQLARAIVGPTPRLEMNGLHMSRRNQYENGIGVYTVGAGGLHWFNATGDYIPWSPDYVDHTDLSSTAIRRDVSIYTTNPTSDSGVVTSLKAASGSPIRVRQQSTGSSSSTGDLELDLDLNFGSAEADANVYRVVKAIRDDGTVEVGPVVSRLIPGPGISFTNRSPGAPAGQGVIEITTTDGAHTGMYSTVNLAGTSWTKLPNQVFHYINMHPYYTGNTSRQSAVNMQFRVPTNLTGNYKVSFFATVFGLESVSNTIALAGVEVSYAILPDLRTPASPADDVYVPRNLLSSGASGYIASSSNQRITFGVAGTGYAGGDAILIHNDPEYTSVVGQVGTTMGAAFPYDGVGDIDTVTAGDNVSITLTKITTTGSEYTGDIGILDLYWKLTEV